jgi:hypothetical protein
MGGQKGHPSFPFDHLVHECMPATLVLRRAANFTARHKQGWRTRLIKERRSGTPNIASLFIRPERSAGLHLVDNDMRYAENRPSERQPFRYGAQSAAMPGLDLARFGAMKRGWGASASNSAAVPIPRSELGAGKIVG